MTKRKIEKPPLLDALTKGKPFLHWGDWIKARGSRVGFLRQEELAAAVGCERTQLYKWFGMELPPTRMKKQFDTSLARALKINRQTLFDGWRYIAAKDAPIVENATDDGWLSARSESIRVIANALNTLPSEDVATVLQLVRDLSKKRLDAVEKRMRLEDAARQ